MARPAYYTKEPVQDFLTALYLLEEPWNDRGHRVLVFDDRPDTVPEIHDQNWGGGYGKCEYAGTEKFQLDRKLAEFLLETGCLRLIPNWSNFWLMACNLPSEKAYHLLERNAWGFQARTRYDKEFQEREDATKKFFVPGVHSSWSNVLDRQRYAWEIKWDENHQRTFQLSFFYHLPGREWVQVREDGMIEHGKLAAT